MKVSDMIDYLTEAICLGPVERAKGKDLVSSVRNALEEQEAEKAKLNQVLEKQFRSDLQQPGLAETIRTPVLTKADLPMQWAVSKNDEEQVLLWEDLPISCREPEKDKI